MDLLRKVFVLIVVSLHHHVNKKHNTTPENYEGQNKRIFYRTIR